MDPEELTAPTVVEVRRAWRPLLVGLGILAAATLALVVLARAAPPEPHAPFDQKLVKRLRKEAPDFVVLGNSMVETRFDEKELDRLLSPRETVVNAIPGSMSAFWYMELKNIVLKESKPKRVVLFFRRRELTTPRMNTTGAHAYTLGRVASPFEPVVEAKLAPPRSQPVQHLGYQLGLLAPFGRLRAFGEPLIQAWAWALSGARSASARRRQKQALDRVFAVNALRNTEIESVSAPAEYGSFAESVGSSFLPDIIEVAERARVPLTLVRVRNRRDALGRRRSHAYDRDLDKYLVERHVELIDMTGADWERPEMYAEGEHIAPRYRTRYTQLFVEHLGHVFR